MYDEYDIYNSALAITDTRDQQLDRDYLEHHGILGMKWGIRRYQNEDGTLTPAGKKRYLYGSDDIDISSTGEVSLLANADRRRQDLTKQLNKDARKVLRSNKSYNIGNAIGLGSALISGTMMAAGARGIVDPALSVYSATGAAVISGLGFGIGRRKALKETGLDDITKWQLENAQRYAVDTSDLGGDIKWVNVQERAAIRNKQHTADVYNR